MANDELAALKELQKLDLENLELRKSLQDIPINIEAMRQDVANIGDILERENLRLKEAEQWRADREREIELQNDLLKKSKSKQQVARNEKESKAAQREIDTIRKNIQDREKETLEVMEAIEQYRSAIAEHTEEFSELEKHLQATEEEGAAKIREVEERIQKTDSARKILVDKVPTKTFRLYERIHKRIGNALAEAKDERCTGCHIGLLPQLYNDLIRGNKLITCQNCYRILYYTPVETEESDN